MGCAKCGRHMAAAARRRVSGVLDLPQDMDCEPMEPDSSSDPMPAYAVPLARLLDPSGRPQVEFAYPKGC